MDFEILLHACFLNGPLPKMLKQFGSVEKIATRAKNRKTFNRRLFLLNQYIDFEIIIQECSLNDPLPKWLKPFCFLEQNGRQGFIFKKF